MSLRVSFTVISSALDAGINAFMKQVHVNSQSLPGEAIRIDPSKVNIAIDAFGTVEEEQ